MKGKVYFVGAGPGDHNLITSKGLDLVRKADVIITDRLVSNKLLDEAHEDAEVLFSEPLKATDKYDFEGTVAKIIEKAEADKLVVRLRNGDPMMFSRGGEEALRLADKGIVFEIVPGVSAIGAVASYAGIPITQKGYTDSIRVLSGQGEQKRIALYDWEDIARGNDTLVFLVAPENLSLIIDGLIGGGKDPQTPAALVKWGTLPKQQTFTGMLGNLVKEAPQEIIDYPLILVVGKVVELREKLNWFEKKPLFGKQIVITRSKDQSAGFTKRLEMLGADVVEIPTIKTVQIDECAPLDEAIGKMSTNSQATGYYDWIIFTSANGVDYFFDRLHELKKDFRALSGSLLAAVGPSTAQRLRDMGFMVDFIPKDFVAEGLIAYFLKTDMKGKRVLLPTAKVTRDILHGELTTMGAEVEKIACYETVPDTSRLDLLKKVLADSRLDIVTFTSSSTVKNFVGMLKDSGDIDLDSALARVKVVCIGPITAKTAEELGLKVDAVAEKSTIPGLIDAIQSVLTS